MGEDKSGPISKRGRTDDRVRRVGISKEESLRGGEEKH